MERARSFRLLGAVEHGRTRTFARFVCTEAGCGKVYDFPVRPGRLSPEGVVKRAVQAGLKTSIQSDRVVCPDCLAARRERAAGESPKDHPKERNIR